MGIFQFPSRVAHFRRYYRGGVRSTIGPTDFLRFFHLDNKGGACGGTHFTSEDNPLMRRRFSVIDGCPTRYAMMQAIRV